MILMILPTIPGNEKLYSDDFDDFFELSEYKFGDFDDSDDYYNDFRSKKFDFNNFNDYFDDDSG